MLVESHITEVTRRRLVQGLAKMGTTWSGMLDDVEFLSRLYDLDALPTAESNDYSSRCALG